MKFGNSIETPEKINNEEFNTFKDEFFDEETAFRIVHVLNQRDTPEKQKILNGLYGETVIDLGAGESVGGLDFAYATQALNYIAVDVESTFSKLPESEKVNMNIYKEKKDMLSYLENLKNNDNSINNFIISGVDTTIIKDKKYIEDVVSKIKNNSKPESSVLVICTEKTKIKDELFELNAFGPELEKQGFKIVLKVNQFINFWALNTEHKV